MTSALQNLNFFLTIPHECSYYPERFCQNIIPDPQKTIQPVQYAELARLGFRRSGQHVYRPHCPECSDCVPVRIDVNQFEYHRNQRRCLKKNSDLQIFEVPADYSDEYFELYQRYLNSRHGDGDMRDPAPEDFVNFLVKSCADSFFVEFRQDKKLVGLAVLDVVTDGLSAVYTFYDPDLGHRGLGNFSILTEIELCREKQLNYLYLGYWIDEHPKMHYKIRYSGLEYFHNQHWDPYYRLSKSIELDLPQ